MDDLGKTFERYRDYVKHQYELTNQRTTWFVTMNAFLFTTFGFSIQKKLEVVGHLKLRHGCLIDHIQLCATVGNIDGFMLILCLVGALSSLIAFFLLQSARQPINELEVRWEELIDVRRIENDKDLYKALSEKKQILLVGGLSRRTAFLGRMLTPAFPAVLSLTWPVVAVLSGVTWSGIGAHNGWPSYEELNLIVWMIFILIAFTYSLVIIRYIRSSNL